MKLNPPPEVVEDEVELDFAGVPKLKLKPPPEVVEDAVELDFAGVAVLPKLKLSPPPEAVEVEDDVEEDFAGVAVAPKSKLNPPPEVDEVEDPELDDFPKLRLNPPPEVDEVDDEVEDDVVLLFSAGLLTGGGFGISSGTNDHDVSPEVVSAVSDTFHLLLASSSNTGFSLGCLECCSCLSKSGTVGAQRLP